jgi:hypothetical protein
VPRTRDAAPGKSGVTNHIENSSTNDRPRVGRHVGCENPRSGGLRWYGLAEAVTRHPKLNEYGHRVLWMLAALAENESGEVEIGYPRLAERCGWGVLKEKTAKEYAYRGVKNLKAIGVLVVVRQGKGGRGRTDQANVYRLDDSALTQVPALSERAHGAVDRFAVKGPRTGSKRVHRSVDLPSHSPSKRRRGDDLGDDKLRRLGLLTDDEVI